MRKFAIVAVVLMCSAAVFAQQDKSKRPSPPGQAVCKFENGKTVTVDYSRPSMKGRKIYGGLVPFGQVWRTGANEATTFVADADLMVGGQHVPKGNYTIFTLPAENGWQLIVSKDTGEWGTEYKPDKDLTRIPMKTGKVPSAVEQFTISFDQKGNTCTMNLDWENTRQTIEIMAH